MTDGHTKPEAEEEKELEEWVIWKMLPEEQRTDLELLKLRKVI